MSRPRARRTKFACMISRRMASTPRTRPAFRRLRFHGVEAGIASHVEDALPGEIEGQTVLDDVPGLAGMVGRLTRDAFGLREHPRRELDAVEPRLEPMDPVQELLSIHATPSERRLRARRRTPRSTISHGIRGPAFGLSWTEPTPPEGSGVLRASRTQVVSESPGQLRDEVDQRVRVLAFILGLVLAADGRVGDERPG